MTTALAVALGGALGALARWGATLWIDRTVGGSFPWGTFSVNVVGCFVLGAAVVWIQSTEASAPVRHFLTVGLMGSFTTFSTYSFETLALLETGAWLRAGGYALGSLAVGLTAVAAGMFLAGRLPNG